MDLQLYFDEIVYPTLSTLVCECKRGNMNKETALEIAYRISNVAYAVRSDLENLGEVMCDDALTYFKEELNF